MAPFPNTLTRQQSDKAIRLVVMGPAQVGKTSIITRYIDDTFSENHTETIEDMFVKARAIEENNNYTDLEILDTSGSISFPAMRKVAIESADVIMLVFSVTNEQSFEKCAEIRQEILAVRDDVPIMFVGNKTDPNDEQWIDRVTVELLVAVEFECGYVEVSAKTGNNVELAFHSACMNICNNICDKKVIKV